MKRKGCQRKKIQWANPAEKRAINLLSHPRELPTNEELLATLSKGAPNWNWCVWFWKSVCPKRGKWSL
jgi:hypothetical protein